MKGNIITQINELSRLLWKPYVNEDSIAVDATCGNGHDTLYLADKCRFVHGFDIQPAAIEATEDLLRRNGRENYALYCASHELMKEYVREKVSLIVFNLGYLPKGDKDITTMAASTIRALAESLELLKTNGLISITMYWGHQQGREERQAVLDFCRQLDPGRYHCVYLNMLNQPHNPPEIVLITKKNEE